MGFTVVTIEGEGENSEYGRLADDLVRRSPLFKSFTFRMWRSEQQVARQREIRIKWKERFNQSRREFQEYEKQVGQILKSQQKAVVTARQSKVKAEKALVEYKQQSNVVIQNLKKAVAKQKHLEKYRDLVSKNQRFFEQEYKFRQNVASDVIRAELMLRALFTYEKLKEQGELTYPDLMFLCLGTQLSAFRREDFSARFPDFTRHYLRDLKRVIEKGWVVKFPHKQQYYLSTKGKERFKEVINEMYNKQMGYYWKGMLDKMI